MAKVFLISRTRPDLAVYLQFCKEALGRRVSNLADSKPRSNELQRYALMLSEAIDANVDNSILDNLGPVLSHISFSFSTVIHDYDFVEISTLLNVDTLSIPAMMSGYTMLVLSAPLKKWREIIIDSLSENIMNMEVRSIIASIYDLIKSEGFTKLWNEVNIDRDKNGYLIEGK